MKVSFLSEPNSCACALYPIPSNLHPDFALWPVPLFCVINCFISVGLFLLTHTLKKKKRISHEKQQERQIKKSHRPGCLPCSLKAKPLQPFLNFGLTSLFSFIVKFVTFIVFINCIFSLPYQLFSLLVCFIFSLGDLINSCRFK